MKESLQLLRLSRNHFLFSQLSFKLVQLGFSISNVPREPIILLRINIA